MRKEEIKANHCYFGGDKDRPRGVLSVRTSIPAMVEWIGMGKVICVTSLASFAMWAKRVHVPETEPKWPAL